VTTVLTKDTVKRWSARQHDNLHLQSWKRLALPGQLWTADYSTPRYYIHNFCAFCNFELFVAPDQTPIRKRFPKFYIISGGPHTNTKLGYNVLVQTNSTINTSYPTQLKLTVKNKNHAYAAHLIPHSQCVIKYQSVMFSVHSLIMFVHLVWWMMEHPILELRSTQSSNQTSLWKMNC
jgi:hypothetical protein